MLKTPAHNYVLRRKPPGVLLKSAHAVDREFRVQKALAGSDVPVSKMHLLCEDDAVIGSMFYIMDHVPGRNFNEPEMPGLTPEHRAGVINDIVLAAMHEVDINAVGLADYGPEGNYFERQVGRWSKQYKASETQKNPSMDALMIELVEAQPEDDGQRTLVHGDYRLDNMIFDAETTDCRAVLDWELSTIGHPFADLAAVIMQWQLPAGTEGRGMGGLDRATLGLPTGLMPCGADNLVMDGLQDSKDRNFVTALARGLELMRCFRIGEVTLTNSDFSERTGLPKATISRLTHTLVDLGYLVPDPRAGTYRLGVGVLNLGFSVLSAMDISDRAGHEMAQLRDGPELLYHGCFGGTASA
ncbi:Acyl-CoA dehydrogenase family member 10 [Nymphon striatum]|nr:Acyl-CoA dehydrogenase family member 10 [Nymphon striatum]